MTLRRLADGERTLGAGEVEARIAERVTKLQADGAGPGRLVRWREPAGIEGVLDFLAIVESGAVVAPERPDGAPAPLPDGAALLGDLPAPLLLIRTSGTTGRPRGIVIGRDAIATHVEATRSRLDLRPDDAWGATLSPAHIGGAMIPLRARSMGCALECFDGFDPESILHRVAEGRLTHLSLVPVMLRRLLDRIGSGRAPSGLRAVLVGGAHAPPELIERAVNAGIPVAATWGMSEMTSQVATATPAETAADPRSVGRPLEGIELRRADDGELLVRGPTRALRRVRFGPDGIEDDPLDRGDGWFATGDLGEVGADGALRIVGRKGERIISGGVNVDPLAVEAALRRLPGVRDALVTGVPDPEWGERVSALIQLEPEASIDAVRKAASDALSPAERPRTLRSVDAIPLNPSGKPDRTAALRLLTE